jgi:hypothetical protein
MSAETAAYIHREFPRVEREISTVRGLRGARRGRGQSEGERAGAFRRVRQIAAPIVEHVFSQVEDMIEKVEVAFAVEEIMPLGDDVWFKGLMVLDAARRSLDAISGPFREQAKTSVTLRQVIWPSEWATRYDALSDAIEDYSETIALGLDEQTRNDLRERLASTRPR